MKDNKNTKTGKLSGVGVALITPFRKNGQVDFTSLEAIVHRCIDGGVDFLVLLGTTAEAPVLTDREKVAVCETVISFNNGRLPLVLGLGGNDTRAVLEKIKETQLDDFSYLLSVAPFYNKPGQKGLLEHFRLVANNSPIPVIAYNIPSRTGVNIEASTLVKIAEEAHTLVALKEASVNIAQISDILRYC
ncbi:MAG: dihydrodipicolinate synthase family protein, partial [Bacteroidales bacterium]